MHHRTPPEPPDNVSPPRERADDVVDDPSAGSISGRLSGDSTDADDADVRVIHVRLNGPADRVGQVLMGLEELPGVEDLVQLGMDAPVQRDDSSTAESVDDNPSSFQEIELELADPQAWDDVRHLIEGRAARADVVLEWLDRF